MARDVAVVLSQSPTGSAQRRALEEQLVAGLLLEDRVEVNVVPHVAHLEADESGVLCLEGIQGDMILLSWLTPHEAAEALSARGIHGRPGRTLLEPEPAVAGDGNGSSHRRIYYLNLERADNARRLRDEVRRIRTAARVQTTHVLGLSGNVLSSESGVPPSVAPGPSAVPANPHAGPPSVTPPDSSPPGEASPTRAAEVDPDEALDNRLESLVDELDQLDL